jgi:hypothetical protein
MLDNNNTWTRVYNWIPEQHSVPYRIDGNEVVREQEMQNFFNFYWEQDSGYTYFPFLMEEPCRGAFKAFMSSTQDSPLAIHSRWDGLSVVKGMFLAMCALVTKLRNLPCADKYFG